MNTYALHQNNSGGSWWLTEAQERSLLAAGWTLDTDSIVWKIAYKREWYPLNDTDADLLATAQDGAGIYSTIAALKLSDRHPEEWRHGLLFAAPTIAEAVRSFENITGQNFFAQGCSCCGVPFSMETHDPDGDLSWDEKERISGSDAKVIVARPF